MRRKAVTAMFEALRTRTEEVGIMAQTAKSNAWRKSPAGRAAVRRGDDIALLRMRIAYLESAE